MRRVFLLTTGLFLLVLLASAISCNQQPASTPTPVAPASPTVIPPSPTPLSPPTTTLASPFGIHLAAPAPADLPNKMSWIASQVSNLGSGWLRVNVMWLAAEAWQGSVEKTEGQLDWTLTDAIVKQAESSGINLLFQIRGYSYPGKRLASLYATDSQRKLRAYENFVRELVRRYKGRVWYWQIENEVNGAEFWSGTLEEYVQVLQTAYRAIKSEDSASKVVLAGIPVEIGEEWLAIDSGGAMKQQWIVSRLPQLQLLLRGSRGFYDILDLHLYCNPDTIPVRIEFIRKQMRDLGYQERVPIWVTETGGPDTRWQYGKYPPGPVNPNFQAFPLEQQQAEVVKRFVMAFSAGVEKVFWHSLQGTATPKTAWDGMTLIRGQERMPAFGTYQVMARKLGGFTSVEQFNLEGKAFGYRFARPTGPVYVLWSDKAMLATLPFEAKGLVITNVSGYSVRQISLQVSLATIPVFVETVD